MKYLSICAMALMLTGGMAIAAENHNSTRSHQEAVSSDNDDKGVRKKPGRTTQGGTATVGGSGAGSGAGQAQQRKKLEKLSPAEAKPLETLDETDPCPTLPC